MLNIFAFLDTRETDVRVQKSELKFFCIFDVKLRAVQCTQISCSSVCVKNSCNLLVVTLVCKVFRIELQNYALFNVCYLPPLSLNVILSTNILKFRAHQVHVRALTLC